MPAPQPPDRRRVYLDNHAATPVDPRVVDAMLPWFDAACGNPASRHSFGWEANEAVDQARKQVAQLIHASTREVIFTSGATESNNLALKGVVEANRRRGDHIITMATEHKSVLDTLRKSGAAITVLPPRGDGLIDLGELESAIRPETILVSVMHANNEIGVIQPVREIGALCRQRGVLFHCDAAQSLGKVPVDVARDGIDLLSMSAHKLYGPKGVGALYVRRHPAVEVAAQMDGGGQERGLRSGTLNVPSIVGIGEACAIAGREMSGEAARVKALRDHLLARLEAALDPVSINGSMEARLPGNLNVGFPGVDSEALLASLPEIALSTGSACTSATVEPSHVLAALGLPGDRLHSAVRFGIGRFNTAEEVDYVADRLIEAVRNCRQSDTRYRVTME